MTPRPDPPPGARNYVLLILDSCRFDSLAAAKPKNLLHLGPLQRRYSYATWTAPAHFNLLMGLLPHSDPKNIFASAYYQQSLLRWKDRLGFGGVNFTGMLPRLWLPDYLQRHGYRTQAFVSLPVLNPATPLAVGFDHYQKMDRHNDLRAIIDELAFDLDRPTFTLINTGETHYPYAPAHEPPDQWPRIHGVHGVFKQLASGSPLHQRDAPRLFDQDRLDTLRRRQIDVIADIDESIAMLFDALPPDTFVTVTADHGELFGEDGYFGHGPVRHDKVLEVPFIEGLLR
ncbi:MAG: arylsulfatase A-like enzyme [Myxococcota bacterium]|jgi:arylsulfatase A-like enzyme